VYRPGKGGLNLVLTRQAFSKLSSVLGSWSPLGNSSIESFVII
jgi:hypothetical protein